jgi:hypothetical protein
MDDQELKGMSTSLWMVRERQCEHHLHAVAVWRLAFGSEMTYDNGTV